MKFKKVISNITSASLTLFASTPFSFAQTDEDDEDIFVLSPFEVDSSSMSGFRSVNSMSGTSLNTAVAAIPMSIETFGATPGGAQDLNYARSQVEIGNIPHPSTFTAEGLFSEHDLPLESSNTCTDTLCVYGEAMPAQILQRPNQSILGQIGFSSGLDPQTWQPAPLNLIAVVDKSGSMGGQPLELVKKSLLQILSQMDPDDQLSIVLYGDRSHIYLPPTCATDLNKIEIESQIKTITSAGSTNMENGLQVGYSVADYSSKTFQGNTRLILFTDERPNVGNTSAHGFMAMMKAGSERGFGLTTIGVGIQFGAELANSISSVRGGNLFYFPDELTMVEKFTNEFSTMVTELAYDMELVIHPSAGYNISGVYGVPADTFTWEDDRSIRLNIETLFLSLRKGALYFSLEPTKNSDLPSRTPRKNTPVAQVSLSYQTDRSDDYITQQFDFRLSPRKTASIGLIRGENLINEYVSLKEATSEHHLINDQAKAYQILRQLSSHLRSANDKTLDDEIEFVSTLEQQLALLSGHKGESQNTTSSTSPACGSWVAHPVDNPNLTQELVLRINSNQYVEHFQLDTKGTLSNPQAGIINGDLSPRKKGRIQIIDQDEFETHSITTTETPSIFSYAEYTNIKSISYRIRGSKLKAIITHSDATPTEKLTFYRHQDQNTANLTTK